MKKIALASNISQVRRLASLALDRATGIPMSLWLDGTAILWNMSHDRFGGIAVRIEEGDTVAGENVVDRPADQRRRFADAGLADHPGMGKAPVVFDRTIDELLVRRIKASDKAQLHGTKGDAPVT